MWKYLDSISMCTKGRYMPGVEAYCIVTGDKDQEATARKTLGIYGYDIEMYNFDNNQGFRAELVTAAQKSSRGGKLSSWTVRINTKNGQSFNISVNADCLLECLCSCTMKNGVILEPVIFAKDGNRLGLIPVGSNLHKQLVSDMSFRAALSHSTEKTKQPAPGYRHKTIRNSNLFICNMYKYNYETGKVEQIVMYPDERELGGNTSLRQAVSNPAIFERLLWLTYANSMKQMPARVQGEKILNVDMNIDELQYELRKLISNLETDYIDHVTRKKSGPFQYSTECLLSFKPNEFLFDKEVLNVFIQRGI